MRVPNHYTVAKYAGMLQAEAWSLPTTAVFIEEPLLLNGQHRFAAVRHHDLGKLSAEFQDARLNMRGRNSRSRAMAWVVMRSLRGLDAILARRRHDAFVQQLHRSSEEFCGLPSITTARENTEVPPTETDSVACPGSAGIGAEAWSELAHCARDELVKRVEGSIPRLDHSPPCPASPCGVIRLAATLVPRAPGELHVPRVPSTQGAQAA